MIFKEKVLNLGVQFQNIGIKSLQIQVVIFILKFIFKIPIISSFCLVRPQLFKNTGIDAFQIQKNELQQNENLFSPIFTSGVIVLILGIYGLIIGILLILNRKYRNQIQVKIFYITFLVVQILNSIGSFILIFISVGSKNIGIIFISIFLFLIFQIPTFIICKVFISFEGRKNNLFSHHINDKIFYLEVGQKIIFYVMILLQLLSFSLLQLRNWYYAMLLLIYSFKLGVYLKEKYYINEVSNLLQISGTTICEILLIFVQLSQFIEEPLLQENILQMLIFVGFFSIVSIISFLRYRSHQHLFYTMQEVVQHKMIIPYLQAFNNLWINQKNAFSQSVIASFRKKHEMDCLDINCFCKSQIKQGITAVILNERFLSQHIKMVFKFLMSHTKDINILLQLLYFRLEYFEQIFSVSDKIKQLKGNAKYGISVEIGFFLLKNQIQKLIIKRNSSKNSIDVISILNLQQTINRMEQIILRDIHVKSHKWKYLCQNICKSLQIQHDIVEEISNIIGFQQIYSKNKFSYKKNIAFNALSLFYYAEVLFFKKQLQLIENNLSHLFSKPKQNFINYQKQFESNIFNDKCCLLEFQISLNDSKGQNVLLIVSNCNKNVFYVFKRLKQKMIGFRIDQLFPAILSSEMQTILNKCFQSHKFKSDVEKYFFIDSFNHVFSALANIKVISKKDAITCVILILEKESQNLILLSKQGFVENVGKKYVNYFGNISQKIPFSTLFYSIEQYQEIKFQQFEQKKKCTFFDAMDMKQAWAQYVQNIMQFVQKEELKSFINLGLSRNRASNVKFYDFLKKQKKDLFNNCRKRVTLVSINVNESKIGKQRFSFLSVVMRFKKLLVNNFQFYAVILQNIQKKERAESQNSSSKKVFSINRKNYQSHKEVGHNVEQTATLSDPLKQNSLDSDAENISVISETDQLRQHEETDRQEFIMQKNSIHSSLNTEDLIHFNNRFIEICFKLFKNPNDINDKRLQFFTFNSIFIAFSLNCLLIGSYIIFMLNLQEVQNIFFADGAVSDNMQLTQFMYNRALNFKLFKNHPTQIVLIQQSAKFQRQYLYSLMLYEETNFLTEITSMTKTKYYQYLRVPVSWKHSKSDLRPAQIQTNQLLLFFYRLAHDIEQNFRSQQYSDHIDAQKSLNLMKINFPELKKINHDNLRLYKNLSDNSLALFEKLILVLFIAHVFISILILIVYYREKTFRRMQQMEGYSIYKIIPQRVIETISNYYNQLAHENRKRSDLLKYETFFVPSILSFNSQSKIFHKPNKSTFITNNVISPLAIWRLCFVLVFTNILFGIITINVNMLIGPIKLMMNNVNDLMDSENYLLESYFDLKANFIVQQGLNTTEAFFEELLASQTSNEVIFNKIAVESLELFSNYDDQYSKAFIDLLIKDSCEIAKKELSDQQYTKCKTYFNYRFLENGVIMGMNFFTRKVRQIIIEFKFSVLKDLQLNLSPADIQKNYSERLKGFELRIIDESIFYMFKLFQATQSKIYESLEKTIVSTLGVCLGIILIEIFIFGIIYPLTLLINYRQEKIQLSKIYVSFLLIPTPVSKFIKAFSGKIQEILEYTEH